MTQQLLNEDGQESGVKVPSTLYKYTTSETAHIVLQTGKLKWSSPTLFNDPGEFQRMPRFEPSVADSFALFPSVLLSVAKGDVTLDESRVDSLYVPLIRDLRTLLARGASDDELLKNLKLFLKGSKNPDEKIAEATRAVFSEARLQQTRVLCLSSSFDNSAMWGHYANSHTGVVLGFGVGRNPDCPLTEALPVTYMDEQPVVGSGVELILYGANHAELNHSTRLAICYTKKASWAFEREWRMVTTRPDEVGQCFGFYKFYPNELESVTVGLKSSSDSIESVVALVRSNYPDTAVYRMEQRNGDLVRVPFP